MDHTNTAQGSLLRILGFGFGIAVVIGSTLGLGILAAPGTVAQALGNVWWALGVWVLVSVYTLLGTVIAAELAAMLPRAGGWYVYARRAFGESAGFTFGWTNWLMLASTNATLAVAVGEFTGELWPAAENHVRLIAVLTLAGFGVLQWFGTRISSRTQEITSLIKALAFIILVAACFIIGTDAPSSFDQPTLLTAPTTFAALLAGLIASLQIVIFAFDGWYGALYFAEEDTDPGRNLPRAMISGTLLIIAIYFLVNFAIFYVLPLEQVAGAEVAAANAAKVIFGAYGETIILIISLIAVLSVMNAVLLQTTRVLYGISRDKLVTQRLASVNTVGTPTTSLVLCTLASIGLVLLAEAILNKLVAITAYFFVVIYLSGFIAMWVLRRKEADLPRPFRAWLHPWSTLFVIIVSLLFLAGALYSDTENSVYALVLIGLGFPAYILLKRAHVLPGSK